MLFYNSYFYIFRASRTKINPAIVLGGITSQIEVGKC